MSLAYNRRVAAVFLVVVIVLSSIFTGRAGLLREYNKVEDIFKNGAEGDGLGIQNDLNDRVNYAYNMVIVAQRYMQDSDENIALVIEVRDSLIEASDHGEQYRANLQLTDATEQLFSKLSTFELTETDKGLLRRTVDNLRSRNDTISHDPYNEAATEYNRIRAAFPASLIALLTGVKAAVLFE